MELYFPKYANPHRSWGIIPPSPPAERHLKRQIEIGKVLRTFTGRMPNKQDLLRMMSRIGTPGSMTGGMQSLSGIEAQLLGANTLNIQAPVAFWRMNGSSGGTESDTVGSNDLSSNNTVGSTTGHIGNCRTFDGVNQFLSHADDDTLSMTGFAGGGFGGACWVYATTTTDGRTIVGKWDADFPPNELEYSFGQDTHSGSNISFQFKNSGNGSSAPLKANSGDSYSQNAWHLCIWWYDDSQATKTLNIKVDNNTTVSTATANGYRNGTAAFWVGKHHTNFDQFFTGRVDALGIFKVLFTSTDLSNLWNGGNGTEYYSGGWQP